MSLVEPPGSRSCLQPDGSPGEGGAWTHCCGDGRGHIFIDLDSELSASAMADSDKRLYRAELLHKMKRAEQGQLSYGADPKVHDVFALERSRNNLLELRHDDVTAIDDSGDLVERHGRLYFCERASHPNELLSVSFFTKVPGPMGLAEQDRHVDVSLGRLLAHERAGR